jgi:hypothetical protein
LHDVVLLSNDVISERDALIRAHGVKKSPIK